ncbi:acetyl-CoA carboxylase biotin carboxyl carrier protein subunit [Cognatitamlana onchidii]|uniref:acetyl-CoA carboxylase biotin carboxyl carrier protein subunit n=1 Tax=Cognatitamlana onchidii TaxID=2562860 RepID=UPI0010A631DC|nr:acetyl-CoA carboxylase biotin carboxyl carrier protein subunit [Algibacter onchidii]
MKKSFKVKVNSKLEFQIDTDQIINANLILEGDHRYHILYQNKSVQAEVVSSDFNKKTYLIKINNKEFLIEIKDSLDQLIDKMGFASGLAKQLDSIKAPMPGLILETHVKEGQNVKEHDTLLILEAMKMENIITSPRDGIIKTIAISKGEAVEKNQLLIEFE